MKYLSDYMEPGIKNILDNYGCFFAFSDKQFNESKKENIEYTSCGGGLICPKPHAKIVTEKLRENYKTAIQEDIKENGKENIIKRELYNHECFYTGDIENVLEYLESYGITSEEVQAIFNKERIVVNS